MTVDIDHYVPVLKIKRGEKTALGLVAPEIRRRVLPLLEIVERKPADPPAKHLDRAFKGLAEAVAPYERCLLDAREIAPDGPKAAANVFRRADEEEIGFIPVTGISRRADIAPALEHRDLGLAIRLTRGELETGSLPKRVTEFVEFHALPPDEVDLILDMGTVEEMVPEGVAALGTFFLSEIPHPGQWRTLILSGSAFPKSMRVVKRHSHDLIERAEWLAWRDHVVPQRDAIRRLPIFSDCAVQHPKGVEGFVPGLMKSSATIRYPLSRAWLLIKGESTGRTLPSKQFPKLARQLADGGLRRYFCGQDHCEGCASVKRSADGMPRLGSPEVWRRIGTVHHITQTVEDLESLRGT